VAATKPRRGWRVSVDTTNVGFTTDSIGNDRVRLHVSAPIVFSRLPAATGSDLTVTGLLVPVGNFTDDSVVYEPQVAFTETITVSGNSETREANFNFPIPTPWMDHALFLSVPSPRQETIETDGVFITYDPSTEEFAAKTPGQWAHDENVRITREVDADVGREVPQDPSSLGEEPDFPDGETDPNEGTVKDGSEPNKTTTAYSTTHATYSTTHATYSTTQATYNTVHATYSTTRATYSAIHTAYNTTYPASNTTYSATAVSAYPAGTPPCETDRVHARQLAVSPAFVNAKLTFSGWNGDAGPAPAADHGLGQCLQLGRCLCRARLRRQDARRAGQRAVPL